MSFVTRPWDNTGYPPSLAARHDHAERFLRFYYSELSPGERYRAANRLVDGGWRTPQEEINAALSALAKGFKEASLSFAAFARALRHPS